MTAAAANPLQRLHDEFGDHVLFTVVVDDLDGRLHTALEPKPNAAYLVGRDRRLLFRSIWASDEGPAGRPRGCRCGTIPAPIGEPPQVAPLPASMGYIDGVLRRAGPGAARDLARAAPPMLVRAAWSLLR